MRNPPGALRAVGGEQEASRHRGVATNGGTFLAPLETLSEGPVVHAGAPCVPVLVWCAWSGS